ncbi:DUF2029 domain-containing protein [candidate division KSB1 bacterium]|nr:DUF2029 domain-containing protein [candidate division KSB1 bacterium]RQW00842.1 MAG: DUF2029 domain-containing protein [candidate division KSB1 bacterium]
MKNFKPIVQNHTFIGVIFALSALGISIHAYLLPTNIIDGELHTHYNNYLVFKSSFAHLVQKLDLYELYGSDHFDYYKYSPSFAFLMFPFHFLPTVVGLYLWNLLNALFVFFSFKYVPLLSDKIKALMLWYVFFELFGSLQNAQSNGVMAGLIIVAFVLLERDKTLWATLALVLSVYVKIFGLVAFSLFFLYPKKLKFILYSVLWFVVIFALPLFVVDVDYVLSSYQSWLNLLQWDFSASTGISFMGLLNAFLPIHVPKNTVIALGILLFCLPLFNKKSWQDYQFRILHLASILIWVIIFNHKAESPTFVLVMCGIAFWYFTQEKTYLKLALIILALLLSSFSPTDAFPRIIREAIIFPYRLKALPGVIVWFYIIFEMMFTRYKTTLVRPLTAAKF